MGLLSKCQKPQAEHRDLSLVLHHYGPLHHAARTTNPPLCRPHPRQHRTPHLARQHPQRGNYPFLPFPRCHLFQHRTRNLINGTQPRAYPKPVCTLKNSSQASTLTSHLQTGRTPGLGVLISRDWLLGGRRGRGGVWRIGPGRRW